MENTKDVAKGVVAELIVSEQFRDMIKSLIAESLDEKLTTLNDKIDKVKNECENKIEAMKAECNEKIEEVKGELHEARVQNEALAKEHEKHKKDREITVNNSMINYQCIKNLKQDLLRNSLRVTGVPESPVQRDPVSNKIIPEDTEQIILDTLSKTGVTLCVEDIDSATRIPNHKNTATPRTIDIRFTRHSTRQKVLSSRRNLKGTGVGVHESLTKWNQFIYDQAKDMVRNVDKAVTA
jgi:hypothetical protein